MFPKEWIVLDRTLDFIFQEKAHIRIGRLHGGNVMMNLRKLAKYALTTGFAFGLIAGTGTLTAEAGAPVVKYDYETQQLTVAPGNGNNTSVSISGGNVTAGDQKDKSFYFYIVVDSNGKTISTERIEYKRDKTTVANAVPTTVDMSGISYKKDVKIKVYADVDAKNIATDPTLITTVNIKAQPAKITAKFTPNANDLEQIKVTAGNPLGNGSWGTTNSTHTAITDTDTAAGWEYKTAYSTEWTNGLFLSEEKIDEYATYGATLLIRQCSSNDGTPTKLPTSGTIPSKEVKLKIPKKSNGPKAVVDPVKITVTIPANCEWRIIGDYDLKATSPTKQRKNIWTSLAVDDETGGWIENSTKKAYTVSELNAKILDSATQKVSIDNTDVPASVLLGATIELRTTATAKKQASKLSYVYLPAQTAAPLTTEYTLEPVINAKKNTVTGLKITNKTKNAMQILVTEESNITTTPGTGGAADTHKVNDSFDLTSETFTAVGANQAKVLPVTKAAEDNFLVIRYTGKKANAKLKTDMVLSSKTDVTKITYPKSASKGLSVTLSQGGTSGTKFIVSGSNSTDTSNYEFYYRIEDSSPTSIALNATKTSLGLSLAVSNPATGVDNVTVATGKYIVVYECEKTSGIIKAYGSAEVKEGAIKK